jgi:hypothetical protein
MRVSAPCGCANAKNYPARPRSSLYSWAEVSAWLAAAKLGEVDHVAAETARACTLIDAALTVRRGLRDLPQHDRPLVARLVA